MKWRRLILFLILFVAAGLRFYGLGARSLWFDESLSWRLQTFPISMLVERTGESATVHPPLYFVLLRFWTNFLGDSEFALRSLAACAGVLTAGGMFLLAGELMCFWAKRTDVDVSRMAVRAGLLASAMTAVNGFQIHLSQQVRGYSLGTLLLVGSSWVLLHALGAEKRRSAPWWWCGYAFLAIAFCYTHNLALFSVAAQGVFAVCYVWQTRSREGDDTVVVDLDTSLSVQRRAGAPLESTGDRRTVGPSVRWLVLVGALLMIGYLPWVSNLLSQSEALRTAWESRPLRLQDYVDQIHMAMLLTSAQRSANSGALGWCAVIILGGTMALAVRRGGWAGFYIVCTGCLPVLLILLYCQFSIRNIFLARYFAFAQPIWLAAFACVLASIRFRAERRLLTCCLLLWSIYSAGNAWSFIGPHANPGMRGATEYILQRRSEDEIVISQTPYEFFKLLYYMRHTSRPVLFAPEPGRHAQGGAAQLLDSDLMAPEEILQSNPKGLWFVTSDSYGGLRPTDVPLPDHWRQIERREFRQDFYLEHPIIVSHYRPE